MSRPGLTLSLRPLEGGAYTQVSLQGAICSAPHGRSLRGLFRMLAFWTGWPVHVVLRVDRCTAGWCELWTDALTAVSVGDFTVEFQPDRGDVPR
jgi:hypothetical protein